MDDEQLTRIFYTLEGRQFWLKPLGGSADSAERRPWAEPALRIDFARRPASVAVGDLLLAYQVGLGSLLFVAECAGAPSAADAAAMRAEPGRERWRWSLAAANLTPQYGSEWWRHAIRPFELAHAYGEQHPQDRPRLGAINFGSDKLRISPGFGAWIVRQILELEPGG